MNSTGGADSNSSVHGTSCLGVARLRAEHEVHAQLLQQPDMRPFDASLSVASRDIGKRYCLETIGRREPRHRRGQIPSRLVALAFRPTCRQSS